MRRRAALESLLTGAAVAGTGRLPKLSRGRRVRAGDPPAGRVEVPFAREVVVDADAPTAYVAAHTGFATVDLTDPRNPGLLADRRYVLADLPGGPLTGIDAVGLDDDRLAIVGPGEATGNALGGIAVYDVGDPAEPRRVGTYRSGGVVRDVCVREGTVYVAGGDSMVVADPSDDGGETLGRWSPADDGDWDRIDPSLRAVEDVTVAGDRAYVAARDAGTWILDVSDPTRPRAIGEIRRQGLGELAGTDPREARRRLPGNHHATTLGDGGDLLAIGKTAPGVAGEGGRSVVELWDVTDGSEPRQLAVLPRSGGSTAAPGTSPVRDVTLGGDRLYSTHDDGVRVYLVSDPVVPELLARWDDPRDVSPWATDDAPNEFFVTSSRGGPPDDRFAAEGAVLTYPDGERHRDRSTPTATATGTRTPAKTATGTRTPTGTATDPPRTTTTTGTPTSTTTTAGPPSRTTTATATTGSDPATSDDDTTTTPSGLAGFGALITLFGVGIGAWQSLRSTDRE